ncbi:hypothetical protein KKF84_02480 [Myxococcota bacterium]|nr:hypothetical protein [Myxococcota bacterium]MBU1534155.1 hypothetical protein [Myxococcota bacterium]
MNRNLNFISILFLGASLFAGCHLLVDVTDDVSAGSEICDNGLDDDNDGLTDCADTDCADSPSCAANNINNLNNTNNTNNTNNLNNTNNVNNTNNTNNTNNVTTELNCSDSIDNDGDGDVDCNDDDCLFDPACDAPVCDETTIFFDNAVDACPPGTFCSANNSQHTPMCTDELMASAGTNYGDCGPADECPVGGACINGTCMPYCDQDTHPDCPGVGVCVFTLTGTNFNLCGILDACTIYPDNCPNANEGCYPYQDTTICASAGSLTVGTACTSVNDCVPGAMCVSDSTCHIICRVANGDADCTSGGTCTGFTDSLYGACL